MDEDEELREEEVQEEATEKKKARRTTSKPSKEKSRYAAQVVVYELRDGNWVSPLVTDQVLEPNDEDAGDAWSEMHLFCRQTNKERR